MAEPIECLANQCGNLYDDCGVRLYCGDCSGQETCGGAGVDNQCGCTAETDSELCAAAGQFECGSTQTVDSCGNARNIDCGSCTGNDQCGIWASGYCDQVVCTSSSWCRALDNPLLTDRDVHGIWGDETGNTYIVAADNTPSGKILQHNGTSLSFLAEGPHFLTSATGVDGELLCTSAAGEVVFPESGGLSPLLTSNNRFSGLAVISATDMWAVGSASLHGVMSHFDGSTWTTTEHADLYSHFAAVSAIASNAVWAVGVDTQGGFQFGGSGSLAAFYDGVQWTVDYFLPNNEYLFDVWAVSATEVWAVGASGTILRHDGTAWSISVSGVSQDLYAITKVGDDLWAAGAGGILLRRVGTSWVVQQSGTTRTIRALWANSNTDLWAGGDDGLLLHYQP